MNLFIWFIKKIIFKWYSSKGIWFFIRLLIKYVNTITDYAGINKLYIEETDNGVNSNEVTLFNFTQRVFIICY